MDLSLNQSIPQSDPSDGAFSRFAPIPERVSDPAGWERAGEWLRELAVSRRRLCRLNGRSQWCELFIERYAARVRKGGATAPAGTGDFAAASGAYRT